MLRVDATEMALAARVRSFMFWGRRPAMRHLAHDASGRVSLAVDLDHASAPVLIAPKRPSQAIVSVVGLVFFQPRHQHIAAVSERRERPAFVKLPIVAVAEALCSL